MENSFLFVFGLILTVLSFLNPIITSNAQTLYVFGDSLYDVGNQIFLTKDVPANTWPYGMSLDDPTGRWSDGKTIPDFIAKFLGIPDVPPALNKTSNFANGANFAVNGATVLDTVPDSRNFRAQVQLFNTMKTKWTDKIRAQGIYMLYIGADDYLSFAKKNKNPSIIDQKNFVNRVIQDIETNLKTLHAAGARKFSIQNLAPLGCLPIVMQDYKSGNSCVPSLSSMASFHNEKLLETIKKLEQSLNGFKYIYLDYYNSILRRRSRETDYRYFSAMVSCCGTGSHYAFGCGYKVVHSRVCEFQRGFMFWDGRNHAEKTNQAFGHLLWSADPVIVSPMNMRELYVFPTTPTLGLELKNIEKETGFIPISDFIEF